MKKVVILLANGFEEVEALTPADYLTRAGAEVTLLATATDDTTITGSHKIRVVTNETLKGFLSEGKSGGVDAVIVPGGMLGSKNISECKEALSFIEDCFAAKKVVAAICAAPAVVLSKTNVLNGKKWTCYPGMEENVSHDLIVNHEEKPFVTDANVVTGRGAGAAEQFAMELVRILFDDATKQKVMKATVQRIS